MLCDIANAAKANFNFAFKLGYKIVVSFFIISNINNDFAALM